MSQVIEQLVTSRDRTFDGQNPHTTLTFHETDNTDTGANARAHANLQTDGNVRQASWHVQGDDTEIIRSFPSDVQCWHAGDGEGPGNTTSEAYEICVNSDGDFNAAVALAAEFGRQWRAKHGKGRDAIKHHGHWSGKNCPSRIFAAGKWNAFVAATDPDGKTPPPTISKEQSVSTPRMVSPVRGTVSSHYGQRGTTFHAGLDIATGGQRRAVYAAFAGTVERVVRGRKHLQPASVGVVLAPYRSGNGVIVRNPDGERQLYGHVDPSVSVGQRVTVGQRIGTVDLSGITTGLHLHFEVWSAAGNTRNPLIDFRHFGVTPGAALPNLGGGGGSPTPPPSGGTSHAVANATLTKRMDTMGYARQRLLATRISNYQRTQNTAGGKAGLVVDGHWGPVTERWYQWVRTAQRALNAFRSSRANLQIDGDYGPVTAAYVRDVQGRNGLVQDRHLGPVMVGFMRRHGSSISHRP